MSEEKIIMKEYGQAKEKRKRKRSITEVAAILSVEPHVLRYWEEELELEIDRSETGRRMYSEEDISFFETIMHYKDDGYKMKEIKEMICHNRDAKDNREGEQQVIDSEDMSDITFIYPLVHENDGEKEVKKEKVNKQKKNRFIYQMEHRGNATRSEEHNIVENQEIEKNQKIMELSTGQEYMLDAQKAAKLQRIQDLIVNALSQSIQKSMGEFQGHMKEDMKEAIQKEMDYQFRMQDEKQSNIETERIQKEEEWRKVQEEHFQRIDDLLRSNSRRGKKRR